MRKFKALDVIQGTQEWRQARCGRLSGSDAAAMLATIKTGEAAARRDLRTRLVLERLVGLPGEDSFVSADMQRGKDLEPAAIAAYESTSGNLVERVGFLEHTELLAGYSPDGVVGDYDLLVEAKCPRAANHLRYIREGKVPSEYLPQLMHGLWVSGAPAVDFFSYCPQFPERLQLFLVRVRREDVDLKSYELAVRLFLDECEKELQDVQKLAEVA